MLEDDTSVGLTEMADGSETRPESLMEQLRARRAELADTKETYLTINGYEEFGFMAKYRLLDRPEVEKIGKRNRKITRDRGDLNMLVLVDTIIAATEGFYIREKDGNMLPITDGDDGPPILTWADMARFVGASQEQYQSSRSGLYFVFGNNEWAIGQHGIGLSRWFSNTGLEIDTEFLGEA
jgi:hypothetical protein